MRSESQRINGVTKFFKFSPKTIVFFLLCWWKKIVFSQNNSKSLPEKNSYHGEKTLNMTISLVSLFFSKKFLHHPKQWQAVRVWGGEFPVACYVLKPNISRRKKIFWQKYNFFFTFFYFFHFLQKKKKWKKIMLFTEFFFFTSWNIQFLEDNKKNVIWLSALIDLKKYLNTRLRKSP